MDIWLPQGRFAASGLFICKIIIFYTNFSLVERKVDMENHNFLSDPSRKSDYIYVSLLSPKNVYKTTVPNIVKVTKFEKQRKIR